MSRLRALVYKEWRDQRALIIGALVLYVLLIGIAKLLGGARFDPMIRSHYVLPACLTLFAVVVAAESVARDVHSGVESVLLRLPTSRAVAWLAKSGFVALASAGCLLTLMLVEAALRLCEARPAGLVTKTFIDPTLLIAIACMASACLASACVLRRSLPAVFLGAGFVCVVPFVTRVLPAGGLNERVDLMLNSWMPGALSALGVAAFLLGSLFAFRVRRVDAFGLRRAAGAALGVGIVLAPAIAGTARDCARAFDIEPFSKTAEILGVAPSPDGRFLAVAVCQEWKAPCDWLPIQGGASGHGSRGRSEVWILDRSKGEWKWIDGRFRVFSDLTTWIWNDRLVTRSAPGAFGSGGLSIEQIDANAGTVVAPAPQPQIARRGDWLTKSARGRDSELIAEARRNGSALPADGELFASHEPGVVFHEQDGYLVRHDLASNGTTRLIALHGPPESWQLDSSWDGRYLLMRQRAGERTLMDACDGRVLLHSGMHEGWACWSCIPDRICLIYHGDETWSALNEDGSQTPLPAFQGGWHELGRDRLFRYDQQRIECMKLDGSEREVLYQARP